MKGLMLKLSVYLLTAVIFTASVGINVFKHICGDCHETFITLDNSSSTGGDCACASSECTCNHHWEITCHDNDLEGFAHSCDMQEHNHEYFHIDELYFSPSKIINPITMSTELFSLTHFVEKEKIYNDLDLSLREIVNSYKPDISTLNCCYLV
jgi:hypothetical protein